MLLGHGMDRISEFELFTEGDDLYASMIAADEVGRRFAAALAAGARAGAAVRRLL